MATSFGLCKLSSGQNIYKKSNCVFYVHYLVDALIVYTKLLFKDPVSHATLILKGVY